MTTTTLLPLRPAPADPAHEAGPGASPVPVPTEVTVEPGPALLAGLGNGPSLAAHREQYGEVPRLSRAALHASIERVALRGRGGAAFPFATKMGALGRGRPVVVVNLSEGECASSKDAALALTRPHLVLDGAVATAHALSTREVHVVLPGERPAAAAAMRRAVAERHDRVRIRTHTAEQRFVAGQARAVLELLAGRPNLPTTSWAPEAVSGHKGRPTLLSNGETWARIGLLVLRGENEFAAIGTPTEPGATLLTFSSPDSVPVVREAEYGARLRDLLPADRVGRPALVGGFHGAWATAETLASARVSVDAMKALGSPLGAGVVCSVPEGDCPVVMTSRIVDYLAGESAGRCGPCFNGLPALAEALRAVVVGRDGTTRVQQLSDLVVRRGACAHPDGTVRLVRSMLGTFAGEVVAHAEGRCDAGAGGRRRAHEAWEEAS